MKTALLALAYGLSFLCTSTVNAAAVFYANDEAGFQAAIGSSILSMESFEGGFTNGTSVTMPGFTMSTPDGETIRSVVNSNNATDGNDRMGIVDNGFNGNTIIFTFDSPINAFSIDIIDALNVGGSGTLTLSNENGDSGVILAGPNTPGALGLLDFGGLVDTTQSFSTVTLVASQTGDGIGFDRLQYGTVVPVPAAIWLFCSGLLGLIGISRRKKVA